MDTSKSYVRDGRIQQKPRGNYFLFSFLFGLALAFVIFVPFMIVDGGRFLFYGDFNVQQVPFYRHRARCHSFRQHRLESFNRPRRQFHRFLFVLPARQPVLLAHHSVPGRVAAIPHGPAVHLKVRLRLPLWLYLSASLCKEPQHGALSVALIRVLGLLHLQYFLQSFSRSHHRVPFALSRAR